MRGTVVPRGTLATSAGRVLRPGHQGVDVDGMGRVGTVSGGPSPKRSRLSRPGRGSRQTVVPGSYHGPRRTPGRRDVDVVRVCRRTGRDGSGTTTGLPGDSGRSPHLRSPEPGSPRPGRPDVGTG